MRHSSGKITGRNHICSIGPDMDTIDIDGTPFPTKRSNNRPNIKDAVCALEAASFGFDTLLEFSFYKVWPKHDPSNRCNTFFVPILYTTSFFSNCDRFLPCTIVSFTDSPCRVWQIFEMTLERFPLYEKMSILLLLECVTSSKKHTESESFTVDAYIAQLNTKHKPPYRVRELHG
jgi:hypothetical protein